MVRYSQHAAKSLLFCRTHSHTTSSGTSGNFCRRWCRTWLSICWFPCAIRQMPKPNGLDHSTCAHTIIASSCWAPLPGPPATPETPRRNCAGPGRQQNQARSGTDRGGGETHAAPLLLRLGKSSDSSSAFPPSAPPYFLSSFSLPTDKNQNSVTQYGGRASKRLSRDFSRSFFLLRASSHRES